MERLFEVRRHPDDTPVCEMMQQSSGPWIRAMGGRETESACMWSEAFLDPACALHKLWVAGGRGFGEGLRSKQGAWFGVGFGTNRKSQRQAASLALGGGVTNMLC